MSNLDYTKCGYPLSLCNCDYRCKNGDVRPARSPYPNLPSRWKELNSVLCKPSNGYRKSEFKKLLKDLQANIVKSHGKQMVDCHKLNFETGRNINLDDVKVNIRDLSEKITNAFHQLDNESEEIPVVATFYLSYSGYSYLQIEESEIPGKRGDAFRRGIDFDFDDDTDIGEDAIHAMLILAYDKRFKKRAEKILDLVRGFLVETESSDVKKRGTDLFAFKDGLSNPRFFPDHDLRRFKKYGLVKEKSCTPLNLVLQSDPGGHRWYSCGSFLSAMKFRQNKVAYQTRIKQTIELLGLTPKEVDEGLAEAYIMGRFTNGTPLTLNKSQRKKNRNDFDYTEINGTKGNEDNDLTGARCPMHAHVRKANPRIEGMEDKRIVRRGILSNRNEKKEDGLFFMSFQRSIEDQLEYIIKEWLHSEYLNGQLTGQDPVTGFNSHYPNRYNKNWGRKKQMVSDNANKDPMITLLNQYYFFTPSISFLSNIGKEKIKNINQTMNQKASSLKEQKKNQKKKKKFEKFVEKQPEKFKKLFVQKNDKMKFRKYKEMDEMTVEEYLASKGKK